MAPIQGKTVVNYFNIRGRGEPIRLLLADTGSDFESISPANWPSMKEKGYADGSLPFHQIPLVEFANGLKLVQMNAILR